MGISPYLRRLRERVGIRGVTGGPLFRMTYPNGDLVSYVSTIFAACVIDGERGG